MPDRSDVIKKFCQLCDWAHESWVTAYTIFDNNPKIEQLKKCSCVDFLLRLNKILQEYALLQLIKLQDPAQQKGCSNLTFEYIIKHGGWDKKTVLILRKHFSNLDQLAQYIRPARHKILSHNDFNTVLDNLPIGAFPKGKDVEYFRILQEFVNVIHDKTIGGPYLFNSLAQDNAQDFLEIMQKNSS
jgi:hypothetical protein